MWVPLFSRECEIDGSIYRCLDADRRARIAPFLAQYRHVRERDGYRAGDAAYYRSLPHVLDAEPQSSVWRIRQQSFDRLCPMILPAQSVRTPAVLDLGAGSGWLSYRLAALGCRPVAVDLLADDKDGLGASCHYDLPFVCVEADFDALPFAPGQFDVVVFNGSLHYAPDVSATLERAHRMLRPAGFIAVVDSPMFVRESDGTAMRDRLHQRLVNDYGIAAPILPGEGYLTFDRVNRWAAWRQRSSKFFPSHDGWRARLQRTPVARALGRPRPPQFGVWTAA
jgi:SAM-dependent methyltransferase